MQIMCLGDSITWGAWDANGGWCSRINTRLAHSYLAAEVADSTRVYNLGVCGFRSTDALAYLEPAVQAHRRDGGDIGLIIAVGTNDSVFVTSQQRFFTELATFSTTMNALITRAKDLAIAVAVVESPPVDESRTHPYCYDADLHSSNGDIARYNAVMRQVAQKHGVTFIPTFQAFASTAERDLLHSDGVHPNSDGHALLEQQIWPIVNEWVQSGHQELHHL